MAGILVCTFPGIPVQTWCKSANVRVVVQPDRGTAAPGPVDLRVKREVVLPPPDGLPDPEHLPGHRCVDVTHRRALLQETGIRGPVVGVAVEQPVGLLVGEAEGAGGLAGGEGRGGTKSFHDQRRGRRGRRRGGGGAGEDAGG